MSEHYRTAGQTYSNFLKMGAGCKIYLARSAGLTQFQSENISFQGVVHERTAEYKENLLLSCRHKSYQLSSY